MHMSQFRKKNTLWIFILCLIMCICMILFILTNQSVKKIEPKQHSLIDAILSHIPCTKKGENNIEKKRVSLVNYGTQKINVLAKISNCLENTRIYSNQKHASIKKVYKDISALRLIEKELVNSLYSEVKQQTFNVYLENIMESDLGSNKLSSLRVNNQLTRVEKTESDDLNIITSDCNLSIVKSQNVIKDEENIIKNNNVSIDVQNINHTNIDKKLENKSNDSDELQNKYNVPIFNYTSEKKDSDVKEKCLYNSEDFLNMQFIEPEKDQAKKINNENIKYKDFIKKLLDEKETVKKETGENKLKKNEAGKKDTAKTIHQESIFEKELELKLHNILIEQEHNNRDDQKIKKQIEDIQLKNICDLKEHETALDFSKKKNIELIKNDIDNNLNDNIDTKPGRRFEDLDQKITKDDHILSSENLKEDSNSKIFYRPTSVSSNIYSDRIINILQELDCNIIKPTNKKESTQKAIIDIDNTIKLNYRSKIIAKIFIEKKNIAEVAESNENKGTCNDFSLKAMWNKKMSLKHKL